MLSSMKITYADCLSLASTSLHRNKNFSQQWTQVLSSKASVELLILAYPKKIFIKNFLKNQKLGFSHANPLAFHSGQIRLVLSLSLSLSIMLVIWFWFLSFLCVACSILVTCQNIRQYRDFFCCCSCGFGGGEGGRVFFTFFLWKICNVNVL